MTWRWGQQPFRGRIPKTVKQKKYRGCKTCRGIGYVNCNKCHGTGSRIATIRQPVLRNGKLVIERKQGFVACNETMPCPVCNAGVFGFLRW